jgi:hypothetical protein
MGFRGSRVQIPPSRLIYNDFRDRVTTPLPIALPVSSGNGDLTNLALLAHHGEERFVCGLLIALKQRRCVLPSTGSYSLGLCFNDMLISTVRSLLDKQLQPVIRGQRTNIDLIDLGAVSIPKALVLTSLAPLYAKIWYCTLRMRPGGAHDDVRPSFTGGELIVDGNGWKSPFPRPGVAWLDIKGAFRRHGTGEPYQTKDPIQRATELQERGTA